MAGIALAVLLGAVIVLLSAGGDGWIGRLSSDDFARLSELVAIALFVSAGVLAASRFRMGRIVSFALAWVAIVLGLVAGYSYRGELESFATRIYGELSPSTPVVTEDEQGQRMVAVRRSLNGHFGVTAVVNGHAMPMVVDTGATLIALTQDDARIAGYEGAKLSYVVPVQTANGTVNVARVKLGEVAIGPIRARNVEAVVAPPGALARSLLGMSFLSTLTSYEVRNETLYMHGRS
jgi:aspartyl protease family protein